MKFDERLQKVVGQGGSLPVSCEDEITLKLIMILEGECSGRGPIAAAKKFGFSKQRYFQVRQAFFKNGAQGLSSGKRGPKGPSRRTQEAVRQIIRCRFLDPDASAEVVAQKLTQLGIPVSRRSVERVIAEYGLQKKTLHPSSADSLVHRGAKKS